MLIWGSLMIGKSTEEAIQCGIKWENGYTRKVMKLSHTTKTLQSNIQYSYYIFGISWDTDPDTGYYAFPQFHHTNSQILPQIIP